MCVNYLPPQIYTHEHKTKKQVFLNWDRSHTHAHPNIHRGMHTGAHTHIYTHTQKNTIARTVVDIKDVWPSTSNDDPDISSMHPNEKKDRPSNRKIKKNQFFKVATIFH